jgi:DHA1 family inner membrane transport protein
MQETPATPSENVPPLSTLSLTAIVVGRTLSNLPFRITSPFLPTIARAVGVSLSSAGLFASALGAMSILAPLMGLLSDRYGRRRLMQVSLLLIAAMSVLAASSTNFNIVLLAFAGFGLAKALYDPSVLAYLGDAVPYSQRGRIMAIAEFAWSAAWLFGVPLGGILIEWAGLSALWWVVAVAATLTAVSVQVTLPPARKQHVPTNSDGGGHWRVLVRNPVVWAVMLVSFFMMFALDNVFILYGAYLEDQFNLTLGAIGFLSIVIALAEAAAELGAVRWTDRIGKQRSVILGLTGFGVLVLVLPFAGGAAWMTVLAFAVAIFVFEYTIVSFIPLVSEVAPNARATLFGIYIGTLGVARIIAPLVGTRLYEATGSLLTSCLISAVCVWIAAFLTWQGIPEQQLTVDS